MEFWTNLGPVVQGIILLVIALGVFIGGLKWRDLLSKSAEDLGFAELSEWLDIAILTAYRTSDQALDEFGHMLDGADRKVVAEAFYDYLPEYVKSWTTKESWGIYVQGRYDVLLEKWWALREDFGELAEETLKDKGIIE